jgi:Zn-dependent protease with chaperone function
MRPRGESDAASRGVLIFVPRPHARNLLVREPQAAGAELRAMLRGEAQGMGERPDLIFGASLLLAGAAAVALLAALAEAGPGGIAGFAAVSAGVVSACILFAIELRHLPPALVVVSSTAVASGVAFLLALRSIRCEQRSIRALVGVALAETDYRDALPDPCGVEIEVVRSRRPAAFCAGLVRPRVVITTALLDALAADERRAVVAHELSHAHRNAPLKLALGRLAVRTLFWVPLLRDLVERYVLLTELEADRAAIAATSRAALAGALSQALATPTIGGSVGLADHAAARIDRLFDARARLPQLLGRARAAGTLLLLGVLAALVHSSTRLSSSESAQLHSMSINLLAHHLQARLLGFAITALTLALLITAARRLADLPARARLVGAIQRALR